MPKGEIVGIFITDRQKAEYLSIIDAKLSPTMMNKRKWQDQERNDDRMARSEVQTLGVKEATQDKKSRNVKP
jgi:hypothetical protein